MLRLRFLVRIAALALLTPLALAACAGSATPELIGSYPKVIATAAPARDVFVVYTSDLDLVVNSVDSASIEAGNIASRFGGYLTEASIWHNGGRPEARVTLAIPVGYYQDARNAVAALGTLTNERLTGNLAIAYSDSARWTTFTHLTMHLTQPAPSRVTVLEPTIGWSPVDTLGQALAVSALLFTTLVNLVIWAVVVLGPFVLLGLGIRWVVRQVRKQGP